MREIREVVKFPKLWKLEVFSKIWEQRDKRIWEYENREISEYENMRLWVTETGNMRYKRIWLIWMNIWEYDKYIWMNIWDKYIWDYDKEMNGWIWTKWMNEMNEWKWKK